MNKTLKKERGSMKKALLCIILAIISIFSFTFVACGPNGGGNPGPVANAELDEYNQIVNQIKDVFAEKTVGEQPMSAKVFASSQESAIDTMFAMMNADTSKAVSEDNDYYAFGIDFSTMTARIAGYAANNYFKLSSFYGVNILMDYGGSTIINASVEKEDDILKTYIFTTFKDSNQNNYKEYNYTEMHFTSQTDFYVVVLDYAYDEQGGLYSQTMIYATSDREFFMLSGTISQPKTAVVFFDNGGGDAPYIIQGEETNTIPMLYNFMVENFELSNQDKAYMDSLYGTQRHSISYDKVIEAKTDLGIIIDMDAEEYVPPIGFVSNKNAEDLVGRKTLQAFVDDGESVVGTTLTIPSEFNYLSGGIYFQANIDTLVIPHSIKGIVVYDHNWNYTILDDTLCYDYEGGRYKAWGGGLHSYVLDDSGEFHVNNNKPFKEFILLDKNGLPTNETEAFVLDEMGNLWLKDSKGNKNYLWGFVSEPKGDTLYLPSPTYTTINGQYIQVEHFVGSDISQTLKNVGKLDSYANAVKHIILDGYVIEDYIPEMGIQPDFYLLRSTFLTSWEQPDGTLTGIKWDLETLTINNIVDGARVSLSGIFCGESTRYDIYNMPYSVTICQTKIDKVILNGDFKTITYSNGYEIVEHTPVQPMPDGNGGMMGVIPDSGHEDRKILDTYAISEDYELNGRANAHFAYDSVVYGTKVVEVYNDDYQLPVFPDIETLLIKSSVTSLGIHQSLFKIGMYSLPEDRKLTIEFENIAGIDFSSFYIYDLMWETSTRVEKLKFSASETYMQKFLLGLEWNDSARWLIDAINHNTYIIEYGEGIPGESEFFANFDFSGDYINVKDGCDLTSLVIDDNFLSLAMQITGSALGEITINLSNGDNKVNILVRVSKDFLDQNGLLPCINGVGVVELASSMKDFEDLTAILDRIMSQNDAKLIFDGTKQEFLNRVGDLGEAYITRLLYAEYSYYKEIHFSNETLYRGFANKTLTYEDERVKVSITFVDGIATTYHFEDKLNSSVNYTGEQNNYNDNSSIYWTTTIVLWDLEPDTSYYNDIPIKIPNYEFAFRYSYGENEDSSLIFIYGSGESEYTVPFGIKNLPSSITLS